MVQLVVTLGSDPRNVGSNPAPGAILCEMSCSLVVEQPLPGKAQVRFLPTDSHIMGQRIDADGRNDVKSLKAPAIE
jgi:hypothetical protein